MDALRISLGLGFFFNSTPSSLSQGPYAVNAGGIAECTQNSGVRLPHWNPDSALH